MIKRSEYLPESSFTKFIIRAEASSSAGLLGGIPLGRTDSFSMEVFCSNSGNSLVESRR